MNLAKISIVTNEIGGHMAGKKKAKKKAIPFGSIRKRKAKKKKAKKK